MNKAQTLLPEFDHEMATTKTVLERVPAEKFSWKPHPKSYSFGQLAGHISEIPGWAIVTLDQDSFDVAPKGAPPYAPPKYETTKELVAALENNAKKARAILENTPDEAFLKPWSLLFGGETVFTLPKIAVLRGFVMNHLIHHRGQLSVYLRLNDIPVPSIYGPSADDPGK